MYGIPVIVLIPKNNFQEEKSIGNEKRMCVVWGEFGGK